MSKDMTCRVYLQTIDLGIVKFIKKIYRAVFLKMPNLQAWTKLPAKTFTVIKVAECKLIKFFLLAIARSNSPLYLYAVFNGIKPLCDEAAFPKLIARSNSPLYLYAVFNGIKPLCDEAAFPKLIIFLKIQVIVWIACYFSLFL